jgi:hypothetical protein
MIAFVMSDRYYLSKYPFDQSLSMVRQAVVGQAVSPANALSCAATGSRNHLPHHD